ncbi:histone protein [Streptomyces sp. NPDC088733]|uniref:histone protein n=1 Tax=Streptomyces sp. NPDC088733 TaxID=3365880 RepID=UPI00382FDDEF
MKDSTKMALAAGMAGGYVLGRTKKARLAFGLATYLAGRRFGLEPQQLLTEGVRRLKELPQFEDLNDQLRGELMDAGRQALSAAADRRLADLAESLHDRTARIGGKSGPSGKGRRDEDEAEDTDTDEEAEEEYEPEEDEEGAEDREDEEPEGAEESAKRPAGKRAPGRSRHRRPAKRPAAKRAPEEKSGAKKAQPTRKSTAKKAAPPPRKQAAKKPAAKKAAAKKTAPSRGGAKKTAAKKTPAKKASSARRR